ncbi:MAG: glucosaminidase domain-containing protein, partial [Anaerococcus sp.]|nr:glucosaminidase domain-containing protein [Anaerococcus sp.]
MKQNSNINLTKITSGALVLLLASGGLFSNSLAKDNNSNNVEKVIVEKKDNIEDKNLDRTELSEVEKKNLDKKSEETNQTIEEKTVEKSTIQDVINDLDKDADKKIEEKEVENNLPLEASAPEKNESLSLKENENLSLEKEEENNIDENISLNNTNNSINNNLEIENTKIQEVSSEKLDENNEPATKLIEDESKEKPALLEDDKSVEDDNALEISEVREKENVQSSQQDKKVSVSTYQSNVQKPKYINDYSNNKEFLEMLASHSSLAKEYNIFPEVMMGQAILESGWGQSALAKYNKNLFGVKVPYS